MFRRACTSALRTVSMEKGTWHRPFKVHCNNCQHWHLSRLHLNCIIPYFKYHVNWYCPCFLIFWYTNSYTTTKFIFMDLLLISISLQRGYFYLENIHKIFLCKHHFKLELTLERVISWKIFFLTIVKNLTGLKCAPSKDSDQPAHSHSRIRVFVICRKNHCILGYPKCAQRRFWSGCANAQADLNLRWAHMYKGRFFDVPAHPNFSPLAYWVRLLHWKH